MHDLAIAKILHSGIYRKVLGGSSRITRWYGKKYLKVSITGNENICYSDDISFEIL